MHAARRKKLTEQAPRLIEQLLDPLCALMLFLVVVSTVEVSVISVVVSVVVIASVTWLMRQWWRKPAVLSGGVAAVVVIVIVGPAFVCGLLAVVGYYAVSLWYLGAPPIERLLDVAFPWGDGTTRTLREQLRRIFQNA